MKDKLGDYARLAHIREALAEAISFTTAMTYEQFAHDRRTLRACTNCVEVVGEATNHLSPDLKASAPAILWQALVRARNFHAHQYFAISNRRLWLTVTQDFPPLLTQVETLLLQIPRPE